MSVREDLLAAKALINTPKELARLGVIGAVAAAVADGRDYSKCIAALRKTGVPTNTFRDHQAVMAAFDRAIWAVTS